MTKYEALVQRFKAEYGDRFNEKGLDPKWIPYYESQERIEVRFHSGPVKRGRVACTCGWSPSFMLMLKRNSFGSSWLLNEGDEYLRTIAP